MLVGPKACVRRDGAGISRTGRTSEAERGMCRSRPLLPWKQRQRKDVAAEDDVEPIHRLTASNGRPSGCYILGACSTLPSVMR